MRWFGINFETGNEKIGDVLSFSLPSVRTCPGATPWCKVLCYAHRYNRTRATCQKAYEDNWELADQTDKFKRLMIGVLPRITSQMHIHESGDFYEKTYVRAWIDICREFPKTKFWGYSRSWTIKKMKKEMCELRDLSNVELFASVDPDMPLPPKGWRIAFVDSDPRKEGVVCSAQDQEDANCKSCGYCLNPGGHVIFKVH